MAAPRMRPRFETVVSSSPGTTLAQIETHLNAPDCPCTGNVVGHHALLYIRPDLRHTWSPFLDLGTEPHPQGTLIRGRFGPHPSIWTFFMAMYAIAGFLVTIGAVVGLSQWSLDLGPTGFWGIVAGILMAGITYAVALMGQGLAQEQMHQLRTFLNRAVGVATPTPSSA